MRTHKQWKLEIGAFICPTLVVIITGIVGLLPWRMVWMTLASIIGAGIGGIVLGVTAKHFLGTPASLAIVFGLGATSAIGTVTLGFIYVFFMRYTMASIGTLPRTVSQTAVFSSFLLAIYIGTSTIYAWTRRWLTKEHSSS